MNLNEGQNIILRITEYGVKNVKFTFRDMAREIGLQSDQEGYVYGIISTKSFTDNPNVLLVRFDNNILIQDWRDFQYSLVPTAFYNYVDYIEIKQAREQAIEAKQLSNKAIRISVVALIASIVLGIVQILIEAFKN